MITVRATALAFINSSSISGAASRSGTRARAANGNAGSCFHTWTWGSTIRKSAASALAAAPASSVRRVNSDRLTSYRLTSDIDRLHSVDDVLPAALVADTRSLARDVEIDAQPPFEADRFQHSMAARKIHVAIAQVENIVGKFIAGFGGVFVVAQHQPALVFLDGLDHIATGQIEVRGVRREPKQLGIGHRHAAVHLFGGLDDLPHVVVQSRAKAHLARDFAELVVAFAHALEAGLGS